MNIVLLRGTLSRPPQSRSLPSGDHLVAYEVTVRADAQPTESVPVVWFSAPAKAAELPAGAEVVVAGRVRRRFFRTPAGTASRTEVVAESVVRSSQNKRAGALVASVRSRIDADRSAPVAG